MKKMLNKMSDTNVVPIEDTKWLVSEKDKILNDQNNFLKYANNSLFDGKDTL